MERKRHPGRPTYKEQGQWEHKRRIFELIPEDGSPIRMKELVEKAKKAHMSLETLSRYLNLLAESEAIRREVDPSRAVFYRRLDLELFKNIPERIPAASGRVGVWKERIEEWRRSGEPGNPLIAIVNIYLTTIWWELVLVLGKAFTLPADEKAKEYVRTMVNLSIVPILNDVELLLRAHGDLAGEALDKAFATFGALSKRFTVLEAVSSQPSPQPSTRKEGKPRSV